jgi:outer membrane lipoprotein SlyB
MTPEVGVFQSKADAQRAIDRVLMTGVSRDKIHLLTPNSPEGQVASVPISDSEQPGMGAAVGTVVGGALGSAGGFGAGAALASLLLPGVGPILAGGLLGAGLLGLGGAAGGAAAGEAIEDTVSGLPHDELFVYEDALRQGRTVVFVVPADELQAQAVRQALLDGSAETIDAAREQWWIGLRSAEKEIYTADGGDFEKDEPYYRQGFEAAQAPVARGKSYDESLDYLTRRYRVAATHPAFRRGYERGREYIDDLRYTLASLQ